MTDWTAPRSVTLSSKVTSACSVTWSTRASSRPCCSASTSSMSAAHDAQCIPLTVSSTVVTTRGLRSGAAPGWRWSAREDR